MNGEAQERQIAVRPILHPAVHHPAAAHTVEAAAVHPAAPTAEEVPPAAGAAAQGPAVEADRAAVDDGNKQK